MLEYILPLINLTAEMAPYLLLGFLLAGILHVFVPRTLYTRYLARNDWRSVTLAALFGIPLPLCSCGVIPTAMSMRREGASRAATVSFLIATPQTGVDSIAATASLLGIPFALLRPVAALATALFGGCITGAATKDDNGGETVAAQPRERYGSIAARCRAALRYGFCDMIQDIGGHLIAGLLIAGAITVLLPDGFFSTFSDTPLLGMFAVLLFSVPMYLCATGSVPVAAALMLKGLSPGAALVLLMAGPATNMAAIMVVGKVLGRRTLAWYLASIVAGAVAFGLIADCLLPAHWFALPQSGAMHACCHGARLPWWKMMCAAILAVLLAAALLQRRRHTETNTTSDMERTYKIEGMMCNHCKANVEKALAAVDGVASVHVDLAAGRAHIEGTASPEAITAAVTAAGYECREEK